MEPAQLLVVSDQFLIVSLFRHGISSNTDWMEGKLLGKLKGAVWPRIAMRIIQSGTMATMETPLVMPIRATMAIADCHVEDVYRFY